MSHAIAPPSNFVRERIYRFAAAVAAGLVIAAHTDAGARDNDFRFRFKSYELETMGGSAALYARLQSRAERYCSAGSVSAFRGGDLTRVCTRSMIGEVVKRIDHPHLDAAHAAQARTARR